MRVYQIGSVKSMRIMMNHADIDTKIMNNLYDVSKNIYCC